MPIDFSLAIDENALDKEWVRQPTKMHKILLQLADCRAELDSKKNKLEVLKASLVRDIRADPSKYGLTKPTVGDIDATVTTQDGYQLLFQEIIACKHAYDVTNAAVQAMDQRKSALENLVKLHLSGYYADPKAEAPVQETLSDEVHRRTVRRSVTKQEKEKAL